MIIGRMLQSLINKSLEMTIVTVLNLVQNSNSSVLHNLSDQGCQGKIVFPASFRLHGIMIWAMPSSHKGGGNL